MRQTQSGGLRVVTLNIDWNKNLDTVLPFLSKHKADVACLQEVREDALPLIAQAAGAHYFYVPMCGGKLHGASSTVGLAIFSRLPICFQRAQYYVGDPGHIVELDEQTLASRRATTYRAVAFGEVRKDNSAYRIATTHFTWTPDGKADEFQRQDMRAMLEILKQAGECLVCGDFNAPRGGEIYGTLCEHFKDNVPASYTTSIDPERHRIRGLTAMVDGIFTTPSYTVSTASLHCGISDHCALGAVVSRS